METFKDINVENGSMNRTPIAQDIIAKMDKWDCIKLMSFCTAKEKIKRIKRKTSEWKTKSLPAIYPTGKLISIIYKELKNLNSKRKK
jgi:hypothetical protein